MSGNGGLDEFGGEGAEGSEDEHGDREGEHDEEDGDAVLVACGVGGGAEEDVSDDGEEEDAVEETDHSDVEFHVSVEDVGELVCDDALEFVAFESGDASLGDSDDGVSWGVSGGEGVDASFVAHDVDGGDGDS